MSETNISDGWSLATSRTAGDRVRVTVAARKDGAETCMAVDLLADEARAFARSILAAAGDAFERVGPCAGRLTEACPNEP